MNLAQLFRGAFVGGVIIIAFFNIAVIVLLIKSIYNAIKHKKGFIFKISSWIKNKLSPIYLIATKTPLRKYISMSIFFGLIVVYTLHQKGIIGYHTFN